jgi:LuxR family maltose regulon positive regulatory protein
LDARTEGWIAGLQFAALAMRDHSDLAGFMRAFTGSNRFVVDYLAEEVIARQPAHLQTFLLQTAILDRMCGPLCDAVLGVEVFPSNVQTFQPENAYAAYSQALLNELERANVFLIPLDDHRRWYRYHHLFAEVLRGRLKSGATPATVMNLHRRASIWFEQQGLVAEAVSHALTARDWERATALIEQSGIGIALGGQISTVLGWLNALPDAVVRVRPTLCIIHALSLLFTNQLDAVEARLQDAERCIQPDTPPEQARTIQGRVTTIRANRARYFGDISLMITLAHQALELLPKDELLARAPAMVGISRVYMLDGDVNPPAERRALAAIGPARASGNLLAFLASVTNLARIQTLQGRLRQAAQTFGDAVQAAPEIAGLRSLEGSPSYYFGLGDVLREWNDLDAAEQHLAQGMELVSGVLAIDADVIALGAIAMASVQQARDQGDHALATIDGFLELARRRRFVADLVACGAAAQAQLWVRQGNLAAARRWAETSQLDPDDQISYPREAEYYTLARLLIAEGRGTPASLLLQEAMRLLDRLLAAAEAGARMRDMIEILVLQALAAQAQAKPAPAFAAITRALQLAEPENYVRVFVDEGAPILALLHDARAQGIAVDYTARLMAAFPETKNEERTMKHEPNASRSSVSIHPLAEPLTSRELEVLKLVAAGHSNQAIAQQLFLALGTVKRHINNIYGKLDVQSRTQALLRARELGLL